MENQLILERTVSASREKVWQAWTDPAMLERWWGPDNVTIPECEVDLRVGGKFYIVMEAGEAMGQFKGTKWPMLAKFTAVEPNAKLAYIAQAWTEGAKEQTLIDQATEITLTEKDGETKLKIVANIIKAGLGAKLAVQGMQAGFTQQLDKLDKFLAATR